MLQTSLEANLGQVEPDFALLSAYRSFQPMRETAREVEVP